jgi:hypothetical protein
VKYRGYEMLRNNGHNRRRRPPLAGVPNAELTVCILREARLVPYDE